MKKKVIVLILSIFLWICCASPFVSASQSSVFAYLHPIIDGSYSDNDWTNSLRLEVPFGYLFVKNNRDTIFFLIDVTKDTYNDKTTSQPRCEDGFELVFDWDGNRKITSSIDRVYSLCIMKDNRLIYRYYQGQNSFSSPYYSSGLCIPSFSTTPQFSIPHRLFEAQIPVSELCQNTKTMIRFGIKVYSLHPTFEIETPENCLFDFAGFYEVMIAPSPPRTTVTCQIGSKKLQVNNQIFWMDVAPMIHYKRSFIPMRYIIEPFEGTLEWNEKNWQVVIRVSGMLIDMTVGKPEAYVNNKKVRIDATNKAVTPILLPPGRVMLPIRFFSETIGCKVFWDSKTEIISVILEKSS